MSDISAAATAATAIAASNTSDAGPGSFSANGYDGQFTVLVPDKDLIIVRHGATNAEKMENLKSWIAEIAACFAA